MYGKVPEMYNFQASKFQLYVFTLGMVIPVIYLLGAIHGLILAVVLVQKDENRLPNRILSFMMAAFAADLALAALQLFGVLDTYTFLIGLDYPITLLYGPLLYLYVKALREGRQQLLRNDYLHFIPFLILVIYLLPFYLEPGASKIAYIHASGSSGDMYYLETISHLKILHVLTYLGGVVYMTLSYRRKLKHSYSNIEKIKLAWLQYFITAAVVIAGLGAIINLRPPESTNLVLGLGEGIYQNIPLLATTLFVYGIGYMGLHQPAVFTGTPIEEEREQQELMETKKDASASQYEKSGLSKDEAEQYAEKIHRVMKEQKLYHDSDLKLQDLANALDISSHNLTEVINRYMGKNFYDLVNGYRVEEVKQTLNDPASDNLTLLAVGLDAGFNSKSTFNSVFKKQTGMTPSQFRKKEPST